MNKLLLFVFFHFIFISASKGQNYLTFGQVYNYDVGDVIQTRYFKGVPSTYTYVTKTVLNKTFSVNNDTIFYTVNFDSFTTPAGFTNNITVTDTVTHLNDSATTHHNETSCTGTQSSIYQDYCNKSVWRISPAPSVSCGSSTIQEDTYLIEGVGGPFLLYTLHPFSSSVPYLQVAFIYYSKQSGSCGSRVTGIHETVMGLQQLFVYPNPATTELNVSTSENSLIEQLSVFDVNGKQVLTTNSTESISVSRLTTGIYFIKVKTDKGEFSRKFIKE